MTTQAKGRVERSFQTAQDRLVKGLRVAGACTLAEANRYLEQEFLAWWNQHLVVAPASAVDAHRALGSGHDLAASLSEVVTRRVDNDYTIRLDGKTYRIVSKAMPAGLRGATVRVERRLDGSLTVRYRDRYWVLEQCLPVVKTATAVRCATKPSAKPRRPTEAARVAISQILRKPGLPLWKAARIDRTRTGDVLD